MKWTFVLVCVAGVAHGDPSERCTAGLAFAKKGDLPRAALYLEDCEDATPDVAKVIVDVGHKLENSKLSMMSISTTPEGLTGETDALPGERFTTPATIWAKAGTYKVTVGDMKVEKTLEPHSRTSVILNAPVKKAPRAGKVDFEDETPEQTAHQGAPAAVKHGTLLPKKYRQPGEPSGPQIDDPLPTEEVVSRWRIGARIAAGVVDRANASPQAGFAVAATASRMLAGPVLWTSRVDYSHGPVDAFAANVGVGVLVIDRSALALTIDAMVRGEVRLQSALDAMPVSRAGVGGAVDVDVAWAALPIATALRFEQDFTELVPGARNHALLLEVGYDWR